MQASKGRTAVSLSFSNHLIKLQSLPAIQHDIETAAKQNGSPLDIKHPQLSLLVDGLSSSSISTVTSCCVLLTSAASPHHRWVESRSLLALLISQAVMTQHYAIIVDTIGRILVDEMEAVTSREESYQCPYSLRTNVHPFISVLNSRPENGLYVVDKTVAFLREHHMSGLVLKLLEPFVKYVLLSPSSTSEMVLVGNYLHSQLVSLAKTFLSSPDHTSESGGGNRCGILLVKLLLKLVPLQPVKTDAQLLTVVSMVKRLVDLQVEMNSYDLGMDLIDVCLSLVCELTNRGLPTIMLIDSTVKLVSIKNKLAVHHFLTISWLLLNSLLNPSVEEALLILCKSAGEQSLSPFLSFPLVQLLSQPTSTLLFGSHDQISSNQKMAATLLKLCDSSQVSRVIEMTTSSCSGQYSLFVSTAQKYVSITDDPDKVISWLTSLTKNLGGSKSPSGASDHLVVVVATILLKYCNTECSDSVIESSLQALCSIAKSDPTASPSILPFFLYLTSIMTRPGSKLALLYSIPNLATHKLASIAVSNTIITLGKTPSLLPIATRLIGKAWQLQDHLFPLVQEFLSRPLPSALTKTVTREVALARAAVIKDVCTTKAEQHGEEMLSLISVVLSSGSHDPLPVAMVIEGLVSLCNAEVIDVVTLWGVIEGGRGRLSHDSRPVVVRALCQLLELAAELDTESRHSNKSFKATALKLLWRFALSQDQHGSSVAWKALKRFQLEDFLLDYLPAQVGAQLRQVHQQVDSEEQDPNVSAATIMSGSHYVQLLQWIPLECLSEYGEFLSSLLKEEVKETGRGVIYSAVREAQMTWQCERLLESAVESLPDVCVANTLRDTTPAGLINATLMSVYGRSRGSQSTRRQRLNEHLKQCSVKLKVILKDSCLHTHLASDGSANNWMSLSCLQLGNQWRLFAETMCDAYYQIRLLDTCSVSVQDDAANPVFQEKLTEAHIWSMDQVLGKLEEFVKMNPDSSSRVFMCLVGVASSAVRKVDNSDQTPAGRKYSQKIGELLFELFNCIMPILEEGVKFSATLPVLQTVMSAKQLDLKMFAILSLPSLVQGIWLHCWDGLAETVACKLVVLAKKLLDETLTNRVDWYVAVVLNQVLEMILPLTPSMSDVLDRLVSQADIASRANSLELISIVSAFIPTFCLHTDTIPVALKMVSSLQEKLHSLQDMTITAAAAQLCSLHFASGLAAMFATGHISEDQGMASITVLAGLVAKAPHVGIFHLSLSIALFGLSSHGHKSVMALSDSVAAKWLQECGVEQSEDEVLPLILGLVGLLGFNPATSENSSSGKYGVVHTSFLKTLSPLVLSLLQMFLAHPSDVVVSSSLWLTLQVYESVTSVFNVTEKVPESYVYLPDSSILNHAYSLLESLSSSANTTVYLDAILSVFSKCDQLPPTSFSKLMMPFLRCNATLQLRCIQCFVHNQGTLGFKQFATYCCTVPVFISLHLDTQCLLLENLPILLSSLAFINLSRFLQLIVGTLFPHHLLQLKWVLSLLTGLQNTLKLNALKPNYKHLIITSVKKLYKALCYHYDKEYKSSIHLVDRSILQSLADVLSLCGECSGLIALSSSQVFASSVVSIIHCCWVATGVRRFNTIEGVVEWLLRNIETPGIIYQFCWLINTVCELNSSNTRSQTIQLIQTDLLHMLLSWTRTNKPSTNQIKAVLILAVSSFHCNSHMSWSNEDTKMLPTLEDMFASVILVTSPESPAIREKLCQCLLEWLHLTNDANICNYIIGLLAVMKSSQEYCKATVWTFVAHIL